MPLLDLDHISVHFPIDQGWGKPHQILRAVDDVSLSMERGEILGLVGESGCGKSTLSRAIMQLQPIKSGRILLDGEELSALPATELRRRRLDFQMVFQDPYASLNPRYSIYSCLLEALSVRKSTKPSRSDAQGAVAALMERVGLSADLMHKYPHEFSGGQRQRIAIARAIAPQPSLILADEPVSALDVSIQSQILNLLLQLREELGLTMIFISHDLSVVRYLADNIAVMQRGKIQEYAPAEQIFASPQRSYTKRLLEAIPHF